MGEMITWVNQGFSMVVPSCNPVIPTGANADEYKVWGEFDCMFATMFNTAAGPGGVVVGIIAMAGAAIFSAPVGVAILMMAITLFVQIFMTLCKAIYTLLLSYLVLALLCVIAPLFIPLLVFDNGFTRDVFWKWVGMVCSTCFQPLFMIGFLSFFVMVEDSFIDGPLPTCNSSYTSACSFKEILTNCGASATGNNCITDGPLFNLAYNIKWKPKCGCGSSAYPWNWPCIAWCKAVHLFSDLVNWAIHIAEKIVNSLIGMLIKVPKLIIGVIMKLFISFTAFVFITFILVELLEVIPHMAREMTLSVGAAFFQLAQVPLQGIVANATKGLGDGMQAAAKQVSMKGPGGMKGALQKVSGVTGAKNMGAMPGIVGKGLMSAGQTILQGIRR
jgi:type IV secretory pathway VirB6-like protein